MFSDYGKLHRVAAIFFEWLCYLAIPGFNCHNKSVAVGNAWIGRFSFLLPKRNAISIQNSIAVARKKELKSGIKIMSLGKSILVQI